ncbi:MAG: hypothetical protein JNK05_04340 [Myxococcales bacterium]|nr:hypothetical protein [Myxococcales bacterium]
MKTLADAIANTLSANDAAPSFRRVRFRLAGYLFTYTRSQDAASGEGEKRHARVRIDMWREDPASGERHWITVATTAPDRESARAAALALVAWVRWCDVGPKNNVKAQAVAESFAMLRQRLEARIPGASGRITTRPATQSVPPKTNDANAA